MEVKKIDHAEFDKTVLQSSLPVLVDFYADWCGPCQMMAPILDQLADDVAGRAVVVKVNVDDNPELAKQYQVMTIPNLAVFQGGKQVGAAVGVQSKPELLKLLGLE